MENVFFLIIVVFLCILAVIDLIVGVSNDAVNFLSSAFGAKIAKTRTIIAIAAIGIFLGAILSNGMMDVARHGIMTPAYFSYYDVICVFLAVMITDVILLDIFNSNGLPTSTTVSMVFELLGGAFAIALIKIVARTTDANGVLLTFGDLINTEKALNVILGIFLSVAIAFVLGCIVQWIARLIFTFSYPVNSDKTSKWSSTLKIGIFSGIAVTSIIWFLLINGLKGSSFMTLDLKQLINDNTWYILGGGLVLFSALMTILCSFKFPVLKIVVLFGTFALAMAFAGNDLVNFIGVPLTGLESFQEYVSNGSGDPKTFMMHSLMSSAHTPPIYLLIAGGIMVLALIFSRKARNVVQTSVDLSRQNEGDELFGASAAARVLVRFSSRCSNAFVNLIPDQTSKWIDSRFNANAAILEDGAAFDQIRATVNLVLAGLLVAIGTSLKLPLSTTYVTFMVAMGSSFADRAWSRESAVFRITGILNVIGGWFLTAGAAFILCFLITNIISFGSFIAMFISILLAIALLLRSNFKKTQKEKIKQEDELFVKMLHTKDLDERWDLLKLHVINYAKDQLLFVSSCYQSITTATMQDDYHTLRQATASIDEHRRYFKRVRKKEILGLRNIPQPLALEHNTWFFLTSNALEQTLYCLKRINDPAREHVGNSFSPINAQYHSDLIQFQKEVAQIFNHIDECLLSAQTSTILQEENDVEWIRDQTALLLQRLSTYRKQTIDKLQQQTTNIESTTLYLNIIQETQQLLSSIRHLLRGLAKFTA